MSDNYNRLSEVLSLINALRNSMAGLTYDDIQERFGWERKTVERMLGLVKRQYEDSFIKMRGCDNKMLYRLDRADDYPPNRITEPEVIALRTALGFIKMNEPLKQPLESLAGKLEAMKSDSGASNIEDLALVNGTASAPHPRISCDREIMETLQTAILAFRVVKARYKLQSAKTAAAITLCPLGFLYGVQNNYLVASPITNSGAIRPRHYILSRIESVEPTDETFDAKGFDIHRYAQKSFGVWISHSGGYDVKWKVKPEAAEKASRFVFHPTQKLTPQEDGSLIVEFTADGLKEMAWHLITWEGMIKPLAPKELVDEYKNQIKLAMSALKRGF
ncbi:MAG: WYL domain-containing protein [Chitinispirillales bacterium]|nr:WYL domain-containing protein [Chitinispirillales bacterium]